MSDTADTTLRAIAALRRARERIEVLEARQTEPIAVIGIGCRFPGAGRGAANLWRFLCSRGNAVTEIPDERWQFRACYDPTPGRIGKFYAAAGAFLEGIDQFDAGFFGMSKIEAERADPQQRLLLETTHEALEDAGLFWDRRKGENASAFVGATNNDYGSLLLQAGCPELIDPYFATGNPLNSLVGRIAYWLGAKGTCLTLDTACSSSLVAVHLACQELRRGETSVALAAGVNLMLSPQPTVALAQAQMLAKDGRCKAFDARADGFVRGEGCAVLVLKRLSEATRAGDRVHAVIRGSHVNQNGAGAGFMVPSVPAQHQLIAHTLKQAGLKPSEIDFVEAHGTGTALGDPIEVEALTQAFAGREVDAGPLWLGSVKSNLGHTEAVAGLAGVIKSILCLQHRQVPPSLHVETPNPAIAWSRSCLQVAMRTETLSVADRPLRGACSSFGASGVNAHVILESPAHVTPTPERPSVLFVSAPTEPALRATARQLSTHLQHTEVSLSDVAFTLAKRRRHFSKRASVAYRDRADAIAQLAAIGAASDSVKTTVDALAAHNKEYTTLADAWKRGAPIDALNGVARWEGAVVSLPTYPFEENRYWALPEAPVVAPAAGQRESAVYDPAWYRAAWVTQRLSLGSDLSLQSLQGLAVGFTQAECRGLAAHPGLRAVTFEELDEFLPDAIGAERHLLVRWDFSHSGASEADAASADASEAFRRWFPRMQSYVQASHRAPVRLLIVSVESYDVRQVETRPVALEMVRAFATVAAAESQNFSFNIVDLDALTINSSRFPVVVAEEACAPIYGDVVVHRAGLRFVQSWQRLFSKNGEQPPLITPHGVYLITGGLGNIGRIVAKYLIEDQDARVVVTTRGEGRNEFVEAYRGRGCLSVYRGDVTRAEDMQQALQTCLTTYGRLDGVIHTVGIVEGGELRSAVEITPQSVESHLATKLGVIAATEAALRQISVSPRFVMLMSSISTVLGGLGHAAYASANACCAGVAAHLNRQGNSPRWLSVEWDTWRFAEQARGPVEIAGFEPSEALYEFAALLTRPPVACSSVVVASSPLEPRLEKWVRKQVARGKTAETPAVAPDELGRSDVEAILVQTCRELLATEAVLLDVNFFEIGGDSLVGAKFVSVVQERLALTLTLQQLLTTRTLGELAGLLHEQLVARKAQGVDQVEF